MHEAAFASAALPAPAQSLGLLLRPYSIGHETFLLRENNPVLTGGNVSRDKLAEAVLICSQTFAECQAMSGDRWINLKLRLWRRRVRKLDTISELAAFHAYRNAGSQEFKCNEPSNTGGKIRYYGAPFLLRLHQFLIVHLRKSEAEAWDYPLGLAKMHWAAFWEGEGAIEVYNEHDAAFDRYCAEEDAKEAAAAAKAKEGQCPV
jgi:hypothetical protein